ncbi:protein TonB [Opitutus sp. GAS368]|jgi:protein TonB|nr:protein TonB [Opitutus sp. GAS368]
MQGQPANKAFNGNVHTTVYPHHAFKTESWHPAPASAVRKLAPATSRVGDWHYAGLPKAPRIPWFAALLSAGLHALLLWGGGARPVHRPVAVAQDQSIIQLVMPPLDEDKEPPVEELENQMDQDPRVQVPRLADVPTTVELSSVFVQPLELSVPLQTDLNTAQLTSIPLKIAPAGQRPSGLKDIFDISQLDHVPEPIVQPAPEFPYSLKKDVEEAQVVVDFVVDTHGETRDIHVLSSTHPGFERTSVDGVAKWRFRPGLKAGRKVNTRMRVPIRYTVHGTD